MSHGGVQAIVGNQGAQPGNGRDVGSEGISGRPGVLPTQRHDAASMHPQKRRRLVDPHPSLSVLTTQIEQWTEHHYPSFLQITAGASTQFGIDPMSTDARAPMYAKMMQAASDKLAKEKQERVMADLVARGIIRDPKAPIEYEEVEEDDGTGGKTVVKRAKNVYPAQPPQDDLSYMTLILVVLGVIGATLGVAAGIIYVIMKYSD